MNMRILLIVLLLLLPCGVALAGEMIIAQEVEGYFYADGKMELLTSPWFI